MSPRIGAATARAHACFPQLLNISNVSNYAPDTSRITYICLRHTNRGCEKGEAKEKWSLVIPDKTTPVTQSNYLEDTTVSMISPVGDFCVLKFYICIYRYGSSLSVYSTLRRILAAVSHTISFTCCILY